MSASPIPPHFKKPPPPMDAAEALRCVKATANFLRQHAASPCAANDLRNAIEVLIAHELRMTVKKKTASAVPN